MRRRAGRSAVVMWRMEAQGCGDGGESDVVLVRGCSGCSNCTGCCCCSVSGTNGLETTGIAGESIDRVGAWISRLWVEAAGTDGAWDDFGLKKDRIEVWFRREVDGRDMAGDY